MYLQDHLINMQKQQIRKMISEKKKQMTDREIEDLSCQLSDAFLSLPEYISAKILFAYISFNQEVRTHRIIEQALADGKMLAVPKVTGDTLEFRYINSWKECSESSLGIPEPHDLHEKVCPVDEPVLMLMPGLAFDRSGYRVGYGKGLYDRYLSSNNEKNFRRIALCYDFQLVDSIDSDQYDLPVHRIICAPSGKDIII